MNGPIADATSGQLMPLSDIGSSIAVSGKVEGDELLAVAGALEASARERSSRRPFES